jgi:hypothetical protein
VEEDERPWALVEERRMPITSDARLLLIFKRAMCTNDTQYLERVEQNSLTRTQPHCGYSRSIDPLQRDVYSEQEGCR